MMDSLAKSRDRRSNAGSRMSRLLNDEEDAKDTFYSTTYGGFEEAEDDNDYRSESSEDDEVDSDFDIDEEEKEADDDDGDDETKGGRGSRSRARVVTKAYKEPKRPQKAAPKKAPAARTRPQRQRRASASKEASEEAGPEARAESGPAVVSIDKKSLRRSTAAKSQALQAREEQRETRKQMMKSIAQRKNVPEVRRLTQEELLAEAKITEEINLRSLAQYQRLEIEKKRAKAAKTIQRRPTVNFYSIAVPLINIDAPEAPAATNGSASEPAPVATSGAPDAPSTSEAPAASGSAPEAPAASGSAPEAPAVTENGSSATAKVVEVDMASGTSKERELLLDPHSRCSRNFVTFTDAGDYKVAFRHAASGRSARPRLRDQMCPVTGERARYLDRLTRTPYANKTAFRVLRHLYAMHVRTGERAIDLLRKYRQGEIQL